MTEDGITKVEYMPLELSTLRVNTNPDFDVYLFNESQGRYVLYRKRATGFGESYRRRLIENHVAKLHIPVADRALLQIYVVNNLASIVSDEEMSTDEKARVIYQAACGRVRVVLENPEIGDNVRRSRNVVQNVVKFIMTDTNAIRGLMSGLSFDYEVYTHSVNVCTYAVSLALKSGINELAELSELGLGMLLHDCGKSKVPVEILKKPGKLTREEFSIVRQHPIWGYEILKTIGGVSKEVLQVALYHHERADGNGYPEGRALADIPLWPRLCSAADVFDALTTRRSYKDAIRPFEAMKIMCNQMGTQLDPDLLVRMILLLGPKDSKVDTDTEVERYARMEYDHIQILK